MNEPSKQPLDDWSELQSQWQAFQPDIKKITKKINWVTWRMLGVLFIDVVVIVGYYFFLFYEIMSGEKSWIIDSWFYLIALISTYGVYLDFKLRLPIIKLKGDSTKDILSLYLARTKVGIKLGELAKLVFYGMLFLFWLWFMAIQYFEPEEPKYSELKFLIFGTLLIGICIPASYWYQIKKQKEYERLKLLWRDYLE